MAEKLDGSTRPLEASQGGPRVLCLKEGTLVVDFGPDRGRRFVVSPPVVRIGTRTDNDIVLSDDSVSKYHASIEERSEGFLLRDLESTNGTYVNNVRVKEAFLGPDCSVRLGQTILRFTPPAGKVEATPSRRSSFGEAIGTSPKSRELFGILERIAPTDLCVLMVGETGTGKEIVAQAIHRESRRASGPMVVFDASAVARELLESALFGHREGAFTGATTRRKGAFLSADSGTIFIDEVGELDLELQPKLLRVLERREVQPLGSDQVLRVDVRVLAATNRDLRMMVRKGLFRQDLYYRISAVEVTISPLRERREDIPLLVEHFLGLAGARDRAITPAAMQRLIDAPWPGNARELKNVVDRALAFAGTGAIDTDQIMLADDPVCGPDAPAAAGGDRTLEQVEVEAIAGTLARTGWNKSRAARVLGISRQTLLDKIHRYGLKP